jgi:hypothetical protein
MRCCILKLGARISVNNRSTSGGVGEALNIINILVKSGIKVDVFTKVLNKDIKSKEFQIVDILKNEEKILNKVKSKYYDFLIVINGHVNFFGGTEDPYQILNYKIIQNFSKTVFYFLCDPNLLFKQIWPSIAKKEWATNWDEADININKHNIVYITQCKNTTGVTQRTQIGKSIIPACKSFYFPFQKFPLLTFKKKEFNSYPIYDISYGGTFRSGKRQDDMIKFYFDYPDDITVHLFGNIKLSHFNKKKIAELNPPTFGNPVKYSEFSNKMLKARFHILIGDKLYKKLDDIAQRAYESIQTGNILLIDSSYDFNKRIFSHSKLRAFSYVSNREDVIKRIRWIKKNPHQIEKIIDLQRQDTKIDRLEYSLTLKDLLKERKDDIPF